MLIVYTTSIHRSLYKWQIIYAIDYINSDSGKTQSIFKLNFPVSDWKI